MGNTGLSRRNSLFVKQDSTGNERRMTVSSRQNTLLEEEVSVKKNAPFPEPLTDHQKQLLIDAWKILEEDIAKVGVITFISLFETHPDVQQVFMPFSGIELEELKHSKQLRAHALRVMAFVQKAVARLYEPDKLDALLRDLGKKHYGYGAKQSYVDLIGPQFIQAIQPSLESRWNAELDEAWTKLFQYIAHIMKDSIATEEFHHKK